LPAAPEDGTMVVLMRYSLVAPFTHTLERHYGIHA